MSSLLRNHIVGFLMMQLNLQLYLLGILTPTLLALSYLSNGEHGGLVVDSQGFHSRGPGFEPYWEAVFCS